MPKTTLINFAQKYGLEMTANQADTLLAYAQLVWQKKDLLNLTSVENLEEIVTRHLCDGVMAAAQIARLAQARTTQNPQIADAGAGAGYIGLVTAVLLPHAHVTLIESLEKRCAFMNWCIMQLGLKNAQVKNVRLGQGTRFEFDFLTERAMGQLPDILEICLQAVKQGGVFMPFQGENPQLPPEGWKTAVLAEDLLYALPAENAPKRHLLVIAKK